MSLVGIVPEFITLGLGSGYVLACVVVPLANERQACMLFFEKCQAEPIIKSDAQVLVIFLENAATSK